MDRAVSNNKVALTHTAHLYARAAERDRLPTFFTDVFGLTPREVTKAYVSSKEPMYAVTSSGGATLSIEFTDDALSDQQAECAAWLELSVGDVNPVQAKATAFGLKRIVHPATPFFYLQAPGGQMFRIVSEGET